jgi:hypothetical protein
VTRFCDEALWLDGGVAKAQGDPKRVVDAYLMAVAKTENVELAATDTEAAAQLAPPVAAAARTDPDEPLDMFRAVEGRWGSREVEIVGVDLVGPDGQPSHVFQSGDPLEIRLRVHANEPVRDFVFGVGIFNADGVCCYGTNTHIEGAVSGELAGDGEAAFAIDRLDLVDGTYKLDVAVHRTNGVPYDYHRLLYTFRVKSRLKEAGIFRPPHRWRFSGGIRISGPQ